MYDTAKRSLAFTVATGGLLLAGSGYTPVQAATGQAPAQGPGPAQAGAAAQSVVDRSGGLLSGNTLQIPVNLGLNLCGDQAAVASVKSTVGGTHCSETGGASAASATNRSGGVVAGNTVQVPVNVPINACGNQVAVASVHDTTGPAYCSTTGAPGASAASATNRSGGVVAGNTVQVPVNVPVNACGNQVAVAGVHDTAAGSKCTDGSPWGGAGGATAASATNRSGGVIAGNTVQAPVNVPVNACGNQVVLGGVHETAAGAHCSIESGHGASASSATNRSGGVVAGNAVQAPVNVPVEVCGNQVEAAAVHDGDFGAHCVESGPAGTTATSVTDHSGGVVAGNPVSAPINVPVNVCGDQVEPGAVHDGDFGTTCEVGPSMAPPPVSPPCPPTPPCPPVTPPCPPTSPPCPPTGPTTPPTTTPPTTTPPTTTPPTGPTSTPPTGPTSTITTPSTPPGPHGHTPPSGTLAHTGSEGAVALAGAGGAVLVGMGLRRVSRRKTRA